MNTEEGLSTLRLCAWIGFCTVIGLAVGGALTILIGWKATVIAYFIAGVIAWILARLLFILAHHWSGENENA